MKRIYAAFAALGIVGALFALAPQHQSLALTAPKGNTTVATRSNTTQQTSYYRATVNFNDAGIASAIQFGTLPQNSSITDIQVEIVTAFNAGSTNVLTVGTTTTATEIVNAADVNEAATGVTKVTRGLGQSLTASADTALYAKYVQTGGAATAGQAVIIIQFVPNNDQ